MSELIIPEEKISSDVLENKENVIETETPSQNKDSLIETEAPALNYAEKTLAELVEIFQSFGEGLERIKKSKEVEAIKSAFYKKLSKEKSEAGLGTVVEEPSAENEEELVADTQSENEKMNPFEAIEAGFKSLYNAFKKERAEYNRQMEAEKEENLAKKQAVIDDLKKLLDNQEDVNATFPAFREIQARWRSAGPIPVHAFRDLNDQYQYLVEKFYDMVKINRDLRDLDFKKNLEAKEAFVQAAEKLAEKENVVEAFRELQKLHEQWKEYGPVAKEHREQIWERFKAATAVINKKYQAYFEEQKSKQAENLAAKILLCEKVEAIAEKEGSSVNEWNALAKQIEELQKQWKGVGFASKKDNQKVYERFRGACDRFFEKKRQFHTQSRCSMAENLAKRIAIIEQAEALKSSTEWKKTTDLIIGLQKQWKEIGPVPRQKNEPLWKRFRSACDEFFAERDKQARPEKDFYSNLKAKKALVAEVENYVLSGDTEADAAAQKDFNERWQAIGFVPFKEKDTVNSAFRDALQSKFGGRSMRGGSAGGRVSRAPRSEKDILIQKYNALQQDIATYENNIGFFSMSKNSEALIKQMQERIDASKQELKDLEDKIRKVEEAAE